MSAGSRYRSHRSLKHIPKRSSHPRQKDTLRLDVMCLKKSLFILLIFSPLVHAGKNTYQSHAAVTSCKHALMAWDTRSSGATYNCCELKNLRLANHVASMSRGIVTDRRVNDDPQPPWSSLPSLDSSYILHRKPHAVIATFSPSSIPSPLHFHLPQSLHPSPPATISLLSCKLTSSMATGALAPAGRSDELFYRIFVSDINNLNSADSGNQSFDSLQECQSKRGMRSGSPYHF
jgi:hypothetical protein